MIILASILGLDRFIYSVTKFEKAVMPLLIKRMLKGIPKLTQGSFETLSFLWI